MARITYVTCFIEEDGLYSCGHEHESVADAMNCLVPDGRTFIRAREAGVFRSLRQREVIDFLEVLKKMPWSRQKIAARTAP